MVVRHAKIGVLCRIQGKRGGLVPWDLIQGTWIWSNLIGISSPSECSMAPYIVTSRDEVTLVILRQRVSC